MDDVIALGLNAKHSNVDAIASFQRWIDSYGERIGLLGSFEMNFLCGTPPDAISRTVLERGDVYRRTAMGYALGSSNSIPEYVPVENYLAMVRGTQAIRQQELRR